MPRKVLCAILLAATALASVADWPMLRGSATHTGFVETELPRSFRLQWAVEFQQERIGAAVEPILAGGTVFIGTHSGILHAISSGNGDDLWSFAMDGAILQSPACDGSRVFAASVDGNVYALDARTGLLGWKYRGPPGGYSAAPIIVSSRVLIGARSGELVCLDSTKGTLQWRQQLPAPIRQTAASDGTRIFVTAEDLRVRAFDLRSGEELWASEQMWGQTARDYYPIVSAQGERRFVIVRTNPLLTMSQRIGRDRTLLARNAGFDDSGWQKVDAWIKSDQARGTPELWSREQKSISTYLEESPDAQTMYSFDSTTGKRAAIPPVLWAAGCQAVGTQPARVADGRLLTFYRSAYGNWNHGVAPLVALGLLDPGKNTITPLFHQQGRQPSWNCFWGTADESQNFVVAGSTVLIVHQGTLSGFDLNKNELFPIHGERDTFGGFRSPGWARNEWHGPGRAGVAVDGERIYWQTGSRILCLAPGEKSKTGEIKSIKVGNTPKRGIQSEPSRSVAELKAELTRVTEEWLSKRWAPLFVDPGLSGREFFFEGSGEAFEALAFAWRHLSPELQRRVKEKLRAELEEYSPSSVTGAYSLPEGSAREWFAVPPEYRKKQSGAKSAHPFGNLWQFWLWAQKSGEEALLLGKWNSIRESYRSFSQTNWKLESAKGDLYANRYIASLRAFQRMAERASEPALAREAAEAADTATNALIEWWHRAAQAGTLGTFKGSGELDPFINRGDAISFKSTPHQHKIALFADLSPELFAAVRREAPDDVRIVWDTFAQLYKTWPLQGEERQVHFGENYVDPPDLALGAFKILKWSGGATAAELCGAADLPFCRADLYYIEKLALALD